MARKREEKKEVVRRGGLSRQVIFLLIALGVLVLAVVAIIFIRPAPQGSPQAVATGIQTGRDYFSAVFTPILSPLFGDTELLTRFFFAVLLFMIFYSIVQALFKKGKFFTTLISAIITALCLIGLPATFITALRTQYGAMGAAILAIIPFVIMLVFTVRLGSKLAGRVLWIFWAVYYFALFAYQWVQTGTWWASNGDSIPYIASMLVGVVMVALIGPIRNAIFKGNVDDIRESGMRTIEEEALLGQLKTEELRKVYGQRKEKS